MSQKQKRAAVELETDTTEDEKAVHDEWYGLKTQEKHKKPPET
jgi:hypothetical protein